jgi:hypothetical protein
MSALLRWQSLPCHSDDDTRISTRDKSPSLSVTYKGYSKCIFGQRASRRFPLWRLHPPNKKLTRMSASSSCPTKISNLESSGTCRTSWSTIVEPPKRLSELYCTNADNRTMLRIFDAYGIETLSCILSKLRSERSYMVRGTRVE